MLKILYDIEECPTCKSLLVQPRDERTYCEDCGWPYEDFGEEFNYPTIGEQLSVYQPNLEFYTVVTWVKSGLISGKCSTPFYGFYRTPYKEMSNEKL